MSLRGGKARAEGKGTDWSGMPEIGAASELAAAKTMANKRGRPPEEPPRGGEGRAVKDGGIVEAEGA